MRRPRAAASSKTTAVDGAGITEWTLSNGATVVLKPTTLKADQILFRAIAPGGTSLASDADFLAARVADDVIPAGGVGTFSDVMLDKLLSGKAVAVRPFISEIRARHGRRQHAPGSRDDVPAHLPAVHAAARRPDGVCRDEGAGPRHCWPTRWRAPTWSSARRSTPRSAATTRGASPKRRRRWRSGTSTSRWRSTRRAFADAEQLHLRLRRQLHAGSASGRWSKPTSPACRRRARTRPGAISASCRRPASIEKTVEKGIAPKSEVSIVFSGPFDYDDANLLALRTTVMLLQSRLSDAIREELGATYSIDGDVERDQVPEAGVSRADRLDLRPGPRRQPRAARVPGD